MPRHEALERVPVALTHPFDQLERRVEGTIVGHEVQMLVGSVCLPAILP